MTSETETAEAARPSAPAPRRRPTVALQKDRQRRLRGGHPWAYSNEVHMEQHVKALPPGTVVRLTDAGGVQLGTAAFNPHTLIAVRMLSDDPGAEIGRAFLEDRLRAALALRERLYDRPFYRLVHAEADRLPGLVIDRCGDVAVVQPNAAWIDRLEADLLDAVEAVLSPRAVVLRGDSTARGMEGLPARTEVVRGTLDGPVRIEENGAVFVADPREGQKTGWFFDQRDNRAAVAAFARGARVLDAYCYAGGFGVLAAARGAESVTLVDRSQGALDLARAAAEANGVADRCVFAKSDVFDDLERRVAAGERYDVVVSDPPAFVKSRKDLASGVRGYRKLARLSAQLTARGGIMFVASCSHNVDLPTFAEQVARGLHDAGRHGRVLRTSGAGADHPVHPHLPESAYLKGQLIAVD
jgi:23S rRNA (cytosine1962-C5)-methyltransferase